METTVVAPVRRSSDAEGIGHVEVLVAVNARPYAIMIAELAHVPTRLVGRAVANLTGHEDQVRRALDQLFTGF